MEGLRVAEGTRQKTPTEVTPVSVSFVNGLASGETISTVDSATILDDGTTGLVIDSTQIVSPDVNVVVSAGIAGNIYFVLVKITTNLGQELEGAVKVVVRNAVEQ